MNVSRIQNYWFLSSTSNKVMGYKTLFFLSDWLYLIQHLQPYRVSECGLIAPLCCLSLTRQGVLREKLNLICSSYSPFIPRIIYWSKFSCKTSKTIGSWLSLRLIDFIFVKARGQWIIRWLFGFLDNNYYTKAHCGDESFNSEYRRKQTTIRVNAFLTPWMFIKPRK